MSENDQCFTSDGGCARHTDCERAALRAEVERLRAENIELESFRSVFGHDDAKKLAAATELLRSAYHHVMPYTDEGLKLGKAIAAFLSGQPEALR